MDLTVNEELRIALGLESRTGNSFGFEDDGAEVDIDINIGNNASSSDTENESDGSSDDFDSAVDEAEDDVDVDITASEAKAEETEEQMDEAEAESDEVEEDIKSLEAIKYAIEQSLQNGSGLDQTSMEMLPICIDNIMAKYDVNSRAIGIPSLESWSGNTYKATQISMEKVGELLKTAKESAKELIRKLIAAIKEHMANLMSLTLNIKKKCQKLHKRASEMKLSKNLIGGKVTINNARTFMGSMKKTENAPYQELVKYLTDYSQKRLSGYVKFEVKHYVVKTAKDGQEEYDYAVTTVAYDPLFSEYTQIRNSKQGIDNSASTRFSGNQEVELEVMSVEQVRNLTGLMISHIDKFNEDIEKYKKPDEWKKLIFDISSSEINEKNEKTALRVVSKTLKRIAKIHGKSLRALAYYCQKSLNAQEKTNKGKSKGEWVEAEDGSKSTGTATASAESYSYYFNI